MIMKHGQLITSLLILFIATCVMVVSVEYLHLAHQHLKPNSSIIPLIFFSGLPPLFTLVSGVGHIITLCFPCSTPAPILLGIPCLLIAGWATTAVLWAKCELIPVSGSDVPGWCPSTAIHDNGHDLQHTLTVFKDVLAFALILLSLSFLVAVFNTFWTERRNKPKVKLGLGLELGHDDPNMSAHNFF